jgi:protein-disulfide isomerase
MSTVAPLGSGDVEVVEFGDFTCEFCQRLSDVLTDLQKEFPDDIRVTWRDFPRAGGRSATLAALGARCANEQGRFWEYARRLFSLPLRGSPDAESLLHSAASEVVHDQVTFSRCLDSEQHMTSVEADATEADRLQLAVTPVVFVNGRMVQGLASKEFYRNMIVDEINRSRANRTRKRH